MQQDEPIAYESRKLREPEMNYPTHDKEMLAIIHAPITWRHYLLSTSFEVYTDHRSLVHFMNQKSLNKRQVRWSELLSEFDLKIVYKTGKAILAADTISRRPDYEINSIHINFDLCNEIKKLYQSDKQINLIIHDLNEGIDSTIKRGYSIKN